VVLAPSKHRCNVSTPLTHSPPPSAHSTTHTSPHLPTRSNAATKQHSTSQGVESPSVADTAQVLRQVAPLTVTTRPSGRLGETGTLRGYKSPWTKRCDMPFHAAIRGCMKTQHEAVQHSMNTATTSDILSHGGDMLSHGEHSISQRVLGSSHGRWARPLRQVSRTVRHGEASWTERETHRERQRERELREKEKEVQNELERQSDRESNT